MSSEKFIKNKTVLITLVSACAIVIISLGIRQTFGMFYFDFSTDLGITLSQFGFSLGLQMFLWGAFAPWFGFITDRYGGHIAVFIGFIFYLSGILLLVSDYNTGIYFVTGIGILIGIALGGTAISIPVSVVAKHFSQTNRTLAIGIVTAAGWGNNTALPEERGAVPHRCSHEQRYRIPVHATIEAVVKHGPKQMLKVCLHFISTVRV